MVVECKEMACMMKQMIQALGPRFAGTFRDIYSGWIRKRSYASWWYEQTFTFAGISMDVILDLPQASQLNYIVMIFNNADLKDFDIRVYTNTVDGLYSQIRNETNNTALNYRTCRLEEKYPLGTRLAIHFANYTLGDSVKITIQADDV